MWISAVLVLISINAVTEATIWDCYDQKCEGIGMYSEYYIDCDNDFNTCGYNYTGDHFLSC